LEFSEQPQPASLNLQLGTLNQGPCYSTSNFANRSSSCLISPLANFSSVFLSFPIPSMLTTCPPPNRGRFTRLPSARLGTALLVFPTGKARSGFNLRSLRNWLSLGLFPLGGVPCTGLNCLNLVLSTSPKISASINGL